MAYWCATCHDRYLSNSSSSTTATTPFNSSRTTDSGDAAYHYRHGTVSTACVDCHTAHGTTATMTTDLARNATYATASSILLKSDNRSICVQCHGTAVNFWNQSNVGLYGTLVSP
jgi:predicted CXXCH cytochrome family protein